MKKISAKFISFITVLTLIFVVPFVPSAAEAATPSAISDHMIRVHLSSYGTPTSLGMTATGTHTIADNGIALSGAFTVSVVSGNINIVTGTTTYALDTDVLISAADLTPTHLIQISGGYSYTGDIRVIVKNGALKIVNHVDYETYVMGILPYEMNDAWPIEALKAQAVAARSYAYYVSNSRDRATQEHDLVNTTASQVYHGYNSNYANCIAAVNASKNQILQVSSGGNVYACYSSSNGGYTEYPITSGAAASNLAYLPGNVKDDYDLTFSLSHAGYSAKITVPKILTLSDLQTSAVQPYKMIRESLAAAGVDTATLIADVNVNSIALTYPKFANPNRIFTGADIAVTVNDGTVRDVVLSYAPITDSGTNRPFINGILNLSNKSAFKILALRDNGSDWTLASTRYGHGSGLSQVGCYQMAASGLTYTDMLAFYYLCGTSTVLITKSWPTVESTVNPTPEDQVEVNPVAPDKPASSATAAVIGKKGIVNISSGLLNVRAGAGTQYKSLGTLKKGATVTIKGTKGSWYKITFKKKTGYVKKSYIKLKSAKATATVKKKTGTVKINSGILTVRSGAKKTSKALGYLKNKAKVTITGSKGSWYKITYKKKTAYVSKAYIKV
jgi:SpoIID/LytB domain protein